MGCCYTHKACLGFPLTEAARIFAVILCATAVLGEILTIFDTVVYIVDGTIPWYNIAPILFGVAQFLSFFLVFSACSQRQPLKLIPSLGVAALGLFASIGLLVWIIFDVIDDGHIVFSAYKWKIGWEAIAPPIIAAIFYLWTLVTMVAAFLYVRQRRIEMIRQLNDPHYQPPSWKRIEKK